MAKTVSIEIIKKCPNSCLHCSSSSTWDSTEIMPFTLIKSVVDGLNELGVSSISLSGGEPFLHPDLLQIVNYIASYGISINIYSCGIVEESGRFKEISLNKFLELRNMGLNRIMFNLQACNDSSYNQICGNNGYLKYAVQSIRNSVEIQIPTEIHFVPMKINQHEITYILKFAEQEKIDRVSFLKLVPHGRAKENLNIISLDNAENFNIQKLLFEAQARGEKIRIGIPYSDSSQNNCPNCHAVHNKLYIRYDGCVFGCEAFKYITFFSDVDGKELMPNNIYEMDIKAIYSTSPHLHMSQKLVALYSNISCEGENCPVQKYLKIQGMET